MSRYSTLSLLVVLGLVPSSAVAQSLWVHRVSDKSHFYLDNQARHAGDILTVLVSEVTGVENSDERSLGRSSRHRGGLGISGSLGGVLGTAEGESAADVNLSDQGEYDGSAETRIEREFQDRITVVVTECLPNGNLRIDGHRSLTIDSEFRQLHVCGIVRPRDIRPDNTVESRFIADFKMEYCSSGDDTNFARRGWLGRCWQRIRP